MRTRNFPGALLFGGAVVFGSALATTVGCRGASQKVATPQMLRQVGMRQYPNRTVDEVRKAVVTGLKLQGYKVVTEQPMVRTVLKLVAVTATASGNEYGASAQSYGESVAWDVDVQDQAGTVIVIAKHRASVNGMAMEQVFESWATTNYRQLFEAIESSLPNTAEAAAAAPAPAAVE